MLASDVGPSLLLRTRGCSSSPCSPATAVPSLLDAGVLWGPPLPFVTTAGGLPTPCSAKRLVRIRRRLLRTPRTSLPACSGRYHVYSTLSRRAGQEGPAKCFRL